MISFAQDMENNLALKAHRSIRKIRTIDGDGNSANTANYAKRVFTRKPIELLNGENGGNLLFAWPLDKEQHRAAWVRQYAPREDLKFWHCGRLAYEHVSAGEVAPK